MSRVLKSSLWLFALSLSAGGAAAEKKVAPVLPSEEWIEFTYQVNVPAVSKNQVPLHIYVPMAPSNEQQSILSRDIKSSDARVLESARIKRESEYGNEFWTWTIAEARQQPTTLSFKYRVLRRINVVKDWKAASQATYGAGETKGLERYLAADRRVPIDGELVTKLRGEIPKSATTPMLKAKAIYEYVVDNMEYKKVGTGWGNGDTYWACSEKYGNCTDFHALLTSMSRAEGIPTQFAIGFPIPQDRPQGDIAGYHCWLELFLPQVAWLPVDASEAKKHPEQRELLFGTHPADRILFSVGRDLKLDAESGEPVNFLIYPHVVHAGKVVKDLVTTKFSYQIFKPEDLKAAL